MTYINDIITDLAPRIPETKPELTRMYALLVLAVGTSCTRENVHDAWAAYTSGTRPDHRDIIPFGYLSPETQARDEKYAAIIRLVATRRAAELL
jgi:hypothetical protein